MIKETMNIHKALSEVKILNDRITDKIAETKFCIANKSTNKTFCGKSIEEWKNNTKSSWESINALLLRVSAIKSAINQSNASTKVSINGKEYTVAEAIYIKQYGMNYYRMLLNQLRNNFATENRLVETKNAEEDVKATKYATDCAGGDKAADAEIEKIRQSYFDSHKYELVDPLDVVKQIEILENFIDSFVSEVDSVLSVSNATTLIEIEY